MLMTVVAAPSSAASSFPETVPLPTGWQAEGVAVGNGFTAYAGSLADGAIYRADLRTGQGEVLVAGQPGRLAVGLKESRGLLYVAGGLTGQAYVFDARTGAELVVSQLGLPFSSFVNDVTVTANAAWFTDSFNATLYRMPIVAGVPAGPAVAVPLTGEWEQVQGEFVFNANGIAAAPGGDLIVINSTTGTLYAVDPATGEASAITTDTALTSGDGILLRGRELSVVRNRSNEVVVLRLSPDLRTAVSTDRLTDPDFDVPTTLASFGGMLYAVNARFGNPDPGSAAYDIVRVDGS